MQPVGHGPGHGNDWATAQVPGKAVQGAHPPQLLCRPGPTLQRSEQ